MTAEKNDVMVALQDARDAIREIAENTGEASRVAIVRDALAQADREIIRLEKLIKTIAPTQDCASR